MLPHRMHLTGSGQGGESAVCFGMMGMCGASCFSTENLCQDGLPHYRFAEPMSSGSALQTRGFFGSLCRGFCSKNFFNYFPIEWIKKQGFLAHLRWYEITGLSLKTFCWCVYRALGGFSMPQQYAHTQASRPGHLTYPARGRQLPETSIKGMQWGLALQNSKAPAVPQVLCGCVVA